MKIVDLSPSLNIPILEQELVFPADFSEGTNQNIGGLTAGSRELTHGKVKIQGIDERMLFGDVEDYATGIGIYIGKDPEDGLYKMRVGDPAGIFLSWDGTALSITGFLQEGDAANDVNTNITTINGGKITALSITAAQIAAGTITGDKIVAGTITASLIAAGTITAALIAANTITAAEIAANAITSSELAANSVTAGKIQAGAVETDHLAANSVTAAKISVTSLAAISANLGTITAGTINAANVSVTNLSATNINNGTLSVGSSGKVSQIIIDQNTEGNAFLRFGSSTGSRIWVDSSAYMGFNALGGRMYFYVDSEQKLFLDAGGQASIATEGDPTGLNVWGNTNIRDGDVRINDGKLRVNTSSSTSETFHVGGAALVEGNLKSNHHDPRSSNSYNLGGDSTYWGYVYAANFVDKSMGWYDGGVTDRLTGEKISDVEAIKRLKPHPTQKNRNGSTKIDKKSFPVELYMPAWNKEKNQPYPRDENDEPYIPEVKDKNGKIIQERQPLTDGASLTHTVALLLGAIKELDQKILDLESKLEAKNIKK